MKAHLLYKFPIHEVKENTESIFSNLEKTFVIESQTQGSYSCGEIDPMDESKYYKFTYSDDTIWYSDGYNLGEYLNNLGQ